MFTMLSGVISMLLVFSVSVTRAGPQDLGSPIRIAQCRAICLDKFVRNDRHETLCQQDPDCFTCWENCGLLQDNPTVWSRICSQPSVCFPGCLQACQFFHNADLPQKDAVMPTSAEPSVQLVGNLATWPRPSVNSKREKERLVYAVIQKQSSGRWRQIIQTAEERCFLPLGETPASATGNLRVLAVSGRGLVALYRPENEDSSTENSIAAPLPNDDVIVDAHRSDVTDADDPSPDTPTQWKLREVSLIHQKVLVIAEVAWPIQQLPRGVEQSPPAAPTSSSSAVEEEEEEDQSADYLVTWEVDGGGLKGHLYTDATSVTLSLWPETVYHIQVDLVTSSSAVGVATRSAPLTIDTHKAPLVTSEQRPLPAAPLIDRSATGGRRMEATVGVGAAAGISLFLLVLAAAVGVRRHRRASHQLLTTPRAANQRNSVDAFSVKVIDVDPVHMGPAPCTVHSLHHCKNLL